MVRVPLVSEGPLRRLRRGWVTRPREGRSGPWTRTVGGADTAEKGGGQLPFNPRNRDEPRLPRFYQGVTGKSPGPCGLLRTLRCIPGVRDGLSTLRSSIRHSLFHRQGPYRAQPMGRGMGLSRRFPAHLQGCGQGVSRWVEEWDFPDAHPARPAEHFNPLKRGGGVVTAPKVVREAKRQVFQSSEARRGCRDSSGPTGRGPTGTSFNPLKRGGGVVTGEVGVIG